MKHRQLLILLSAAAAVTIVAVLIISRQYAPLVQERDSAKAEPAENAPESGKTRVSSLPDVSTKLEPADQAKAHRQKIAETRKLASQKLSAVMQGETPPLSEEEQAAIDKGIVDSISSLTQQIINDPSFASHAIAMMAAEDDPEVLAMLAQAIGQAAAELGDKFPADLMLKMAQTDNNLIRREAALRVLGYLKKVSPEIEQGVVDLAQNAPTPELRTIAINAMGAWVSANREMATRVTDQLLAARNATDDSMVRGMVLQTIGNLEVPLSPKAVEAMGDAIKNESEPLNRSLAAVALGSGTNSANREQVISTLEQAYAGEQNLDTQRHILTQIVKASRWDAETYLERIPKPHPLLQQDVEDYLSILAQVDRNDWDAIWSKKSDLDHQRNTYPASHGGHGTDDN